MIQKLFRAIGLKLERIPASRDLGDLKFGRYTIKTTSTALKAAYRDFPESNAFIARIIALLANTGQISIIDIGANCGDTLAISKLGSSEINALCIEGEESLLQTLKTNSQQFTGITIENLYLGETTEFVHVSVEKKGWNNTLTPSKEGERILVKRLDEVVVSWEALPQLRFIKCDTEGYDVKILFGARDTLTRYQPVLLFEYNRQAMSATGEEGFRIFSYLEELDYSDVLVYDNFGRFLLATDLASKDLIQDLDDYCDGTANGLYYYDILAFSRRDSQVAATFRSSERVYRREIKSL